LAATRSALTSLESSCDEDLNGSRLRHTTWVSNVIEDLGSSNLTAVGNQYYLYNSGGTGPALKVGGVAITAGQFGSSWAPIGAERSEEGHVGKGEGARGACGGYNK